MTNRAFSENDWVWRAADYLRCANAVLLLALLGVLLVIGHTRWRAGQHSSAAMCLSMALLSIGALVGSMLHLGAKPSWALPVWTAGAIAGLISAPMLLREIRTGLWEREGIALHKQAKVLDLEERAERIRYIRGAQPRALTNPMHTPALPPLYGSGQSGRAR